MKKRLQMDINNSRNQPCERKDNFEDVKPESVKNIIEQETHSIDSIIQSAHNKESGDLYDDENFDWSVDHKDSIDQYDDVLNREFLPGTTYFENDVTTDEEDEEHDKLFGHLELFFHAINEPKHIPLFEKQRVTLGQLLDFDESDLINCGIELVGDRKKILDSIAQWHSEKWLPQSLNDMTGKKMLTAPGIYISLNDMNKHVEYIGATMRYIRRVIQKKPQILELGKDYCGVRRIDAELEDLSRTHERVGEYLKNLKGEVTKHVNDPLLLPTNEINDYYITRAKIAKNIIPLGSIALGALVGIALASKLIIPRIIRF